MKYLILLILTGCSMQRDIVTAPSREKCPKEYTYIYSNQYPFYAVCKLTITNSVKQF